VYIGGHQLKRIILDIKLNC